MPVETVTAEPRSLARTIAAVGTLESPQVTDVAAEIGGKIVRLDVPEGETVQAGRLLAKLDDVQARARVRVARARLQDAERQVRRARELLAARVDTQDRLDAARIARDGAQAEVEEAEAALEKTEIRAPFAGRLGLRRIDLGAYVAPGTPIVQITQTSPLDLVFHVPQRHLAKLREGQRVRGAFDHCRVVFEGTVRIVEPLLDARTRSVRVKAEVPNADGVLAPGVGVDVRLEVERIADALVIPQSAIVRQGTRHRIFVVNGESTAQARDVTFGEFLPEGVEITSGLAAGEQVVAAGHQKLMPGAPVAPQPHRIVDNPILALGTADSDRPCEF